LCVCVSVSASRSRSWTFQGTSPINYLVIKTYQLAEQTGSYTPKPTREEYSSNIQFPVNPLLISGKTIKLFIALLWQLNMWALKILSFGNIYQYFLIRMWVIMWTRN